ncbi:hypothetical protein K1T71_009787 [Dendrolimus kikuchii]|uniref:Uncharacterized protein n=1 Tax=Dendrolimus kikuchii TaxID=765133 RepID=A0ACC1CSM8_9NEOP|nr:hypothetical protein K1T71_009787 [Dendrolimus kikuchii]
MKTVIILLGLVALALGSVVPVHQHKYTTKDVDAKFVEVQRKILWLFQDVEQINTDDEYYKIGKDYDIAANIENYTNKKAVEEFLVMYKSGTMLPKYHVFTIFKENMREQAIALFHLFYYAKDFETFYKTAAFARVYLNEGLFLYTYYIAVLQRPDTHGYVLPAPYEVYPQLFANLDVLNRIYDIKMENGIVDSDSAAQYGIVKENDYFVFYANYSSAFIFNSEEQKLAYLTEDVGFNAYYYYFHSHLPFWWSSTKYGPLKERRGEVYFYFYQQLLARYYLERLTNCLGPIPQFSWYSPIKTGFYPLMTTYYTPLVQRPDLYVVHTEKNYEKVRFLDIYEKTFHQYLQEGQFTAFNKTISFFDPSAINFVGNFWQDNADLYDEEVTKKFQRSYEIVARQVLGAGPETVDKYTVMPSVLDFYQTSLRDPVFYQLYSRIMDYIIEFKEYQEPYSSQNLLFSGVEVTDIEVTKLTTFFEFYDFDASDSIFLSKEEMKSYPHTFKVRQPRLNHKSFTVNIDVKSDTACDAVVKIFIGPKYNENGFPVSLEKDWMKFYELDWFTQKLNQGQNKITRKSDDFVMFKEDSVPMTEIFKLLDQGKIPKYMSEYFYSMPNRLMLPKGTPGGYPFELFVFVYPYEAASKDLAAFEEFLPVNKPFGYPLDRPVLDASFKQPNMYFKEVQINHEGEVYPYTLNVPSYFTKPNVVPKH